MAWGLGGWFGLSRKKAARTSDSDDADPRPASGVGSRSRDCGDEPKGMAAATHRPRKAAAAAAAGARAAEKKVTFKAGAAGHATRSQRAAPREAEPASPPQQQQQQQQPVRRGRRERRSTPQAVAAAPEPAAEEAVPAAEEGRPPRKKPRQQPPQPSQQQQQQRRSGRQQGEAPQQQQEQQRKSGRQRSQPPEDLPQQPALAPSGRRGRPSKPRAGALGEGEEEAPGQSNRAPEPVVDPPAPSGNEPPRTTGGLKRVRSSWKMRPLFIDEKLRVFVEGQDDELMHYDGGEFYQWLKDAETGDANPDEGFCYPLIVQDQDMRTVLEIKPPGEGKQQQQDAIGHVAVEGPITVPMIKELPRDQQPDAMLDAELAGGGAAAGSPASQQAQEQSGGAASAEVAAQVEEMEEEEEEVGDLDPPYVRYLEPTPDDLDLTVEYDLDEEDEEWLEDFNDKARKGKSRKARRHLSEDWLERLMDRMEKEYTHALQRNPEKWVVTQPREGADSDVPSIKLPPIEEVFPLKDCMLAPGMHHYPNIIEAVYRYWKQKHSRAGYPLIQRLWYEPPWHRKKAAERLADDDGGDGPFLAQDAPVVLNVRRRKLDTEEIRSRFSEIRRDLDAARLLADQVRKREKLKKQELKLFQEEWAARLAEIAAGKPVMLRNGQLRNPPPALSTLARMRAAGGGADALAVMAPGADQDGADGAGAVEDRAARLAARRSARDAAAAAGFKKRAHHPHHKSAGRGHNPRKPPAPRRRQAQDDNSANALEEEEVEDAADATTSRRQQKPASRQQQQKEKPAATQQQRQQKQAQQQKQQKQPPTAGQKQSHRKQVEREDKEERERKEAVAAPAAARQQQRRGRQQAHAVTRQQPNPSRDRKGGRGGSNKRRREAEPEQEEPHSSQPSSSEGNSEVPHKENQAPPARAAKRSRQQAAPAVGGSSARPARGQHQHQQALQEPAAAGGQRGSGGSAAAAARPSAKPLKESNSSANVAGASRAAAASKKRGGAAAAPKASGRKTAGQAAARKTPASASKRPAGASPPISKEVLALLGATIHDVHVKH